MQVCLTRIEQGKPVKVFRHSLFYHTVVILVGERVASFWLTSGSYTAQRLSATAATARPVVLP